ncbi:MAG: hypothetical protein DMD81_09750 [Candidatus Rokuibacteriota bacterium]|nr:MAG: hypothetical protein DMD81_09750 [Candidatus Rokubacteria bacterium]
MADPFTTRIKVRHYEVDGYGHVNHANYVHYFEAGRVEALEKIGLGLPEMQRQGYHIVAVEIAVKFLAPAHPGESLDIVTRVREVRAARSFWTQEIREVASGRLVATAEVVGAFTNAEGRPLRIPAAFRDRLAALAPIDGPCP